LEYDLINFGGGASFFGIQSEESPEPTIDLSEMDKISIGDIALDIIHTPGHTPGHISLYHKESAVLFCGDVLFHRSIGRTDMPGGNHALLIKSIHEKLFTLPEETIVYSGHGPETRIADEKKENPWAAL
jgi:glyoxylase-like metal-dependent hydrolase (beta-lactamase superfamily II)